MKKRLDIFERVILCGACLASLAISPFISYEPINIPKLIVLGVFGTILTLLLIIKRKALFAKPYTVVIFLTILYLFWSVIVAVISKIQFNTEFYGVFGRNNGLLATLMFVVFFLSAMISSNENFNKSLLLFLIFTGILSAVYGFVQSIGQDPFGWISDNVLVFGFFGNPNFQASFLGIAATAAFANVFNKRSDTRIRLGLSVFIFLALFVIFETKSQQGYIVFIIGASVIVYMRLIADNFWKRFNLLYIWFWLVCIIIVLLDIMQRVPWASFLYKESVSYRGDFWRAGWDMTLSNPFFGVGLDGYRENYRLYRDQISVSRNSNSFVDSAHNIFLDVSSSGGFPLLIFYSLIVLLVLISGISVIRSSTDFDYVFAGLFASWIAYTAQSIISIQQLGISIWGWILAGAIIGFSIRTRQSESNPVTESKALVTFSIWIGAAVGLLVTLPIFITDAQFRTAILKGEITKIEKVLMKWPQNVYNMSFASELFRIGGFPDQSLNMAKQAILVNPDNFEAWQQLYLSPNATENERISALMKLRELYPLNPNLK
jgi:O-antigen ligase